MKQLSAQLTEFLALSPASVAASTAINGFALPMVGLVGDLAVFVPTALTAGTVAAKLQTSVDATSGDFADLDYTVNPGAEATISTHTPTVTTLFVNLREAKQDVRLVLTPDGSAAGTVAGVAAAERQET